MKKFLERYDQKKTVRTYGYERHTERIRKLENFNNGLEQVEEIILEFEDESFKLTRSDKNKEISKEIKYLRNMGLCKAAKCKKNWCS